LIIEMGQSRINESKRRQLGAESLTFESGELSFGTNGKHYKQYFEPTESKLRGTIGQKLATAETPWDVAVKHYGMLRSEWL